MRPSSTIFFAGWLGLVSVSATAAVSLDGLATNSPFMPAGSANAAPAPAEGAAVEFRGLISTKDGMLFGLYDRSRNLGAWVREKEQGAEFAVRSYDASADLLTFDYQGQKFTLPLASARIGTAAPSAVATRPPAPPPPGGAPAVVPPDATRLESVAAEVRRRRALRQAAANPPAAVPVAPAGPGQ